MRAGWDLSLTGSDEWDGCFIAAYHMKLSCWLTREAEAGGGGAWGFASVWRAWRVGCPSQWLITHLSVLSVWQAVFQSYTKVAALRWILSALELCL